MGRAIRGMGGGVLILLVVAGCALGRAAAPLSAPSVPTFPSAAAPPAASTAPRSTLLPVDCDQQLSHEQVPALLGLPLGAVAVSTIHDLPAPAVGRVERLVCRYTRPEQGGAPVLQVISNGFTTPTAAATQLQVNIDAERADARSAAAVAIGAASGELFTEAGQSILMLGYTRYLLTLTLPAGQQPVDDQSPAVLTDLAQRVLATTVNGG